LEFVECWSVLLVGDDKIRWLEILLVGAGKSRYWSILSVGVYKTRGLEIVNQGAGESFQLEPRSSCCCRILEVGASY